VAVRKHGSLASVAEEKQRRVKDKIEGRVRRRAAEQQAEQVAAQVVARVQAAMDRHSTQSSGKTAHEEGKLAQQPDRFSAVPRLYLFWFEATHLV
jgi:hypothetical protein